MTGWAKKVGPQTHGRDCVKSSAEEVLMAPTVNCFKGRFTVLTDSVPTTDTVWNGNTDQLKMPYETTIQTLLQLDNTI